MSARLAYHQLGNHVAEIELLQYLAGAGIAPFERAAVRAYKRAELKKANKGLFFKKFHWYTTALDRYSGPVPLEVLKMAVGIKEAGHTPSFRVDYLSRERSELPVDPFLVATFGDWDDTARYFYLAVWDEPGFMIK